jgi:hypothetical protein
MSDVIDKNLQVADLPNIAVVTEVIKQPVVNVEGLQIGGFTVRAKMNAPAHAFSNDIYKVKVLKPIELTGLQVDPGSIMEHGEFQFDSPKEPKIGDKLEISITLA